MGISLNGLTPAGTYPGLIKTGDNTAIDGTLKVLSDGNGNNLPMEVSTTGVNFTNNLTQGGTALQPVLVSGTNIKTINSTSILGSGNINVVTSPSGVSGAIQFSNGSAFASDATNFFWDDTNNRLGIGTNAPTAPLTVKGPTNTGTILLSLENSTRKIIDINDRGAITANAYNSANQIYSLGFYGAFDGGGLILNGASNSNGVLLAGQSGVDNYVLNNLGIGTTTPSARLGIKGSGSTSATTSLLVQNSAGNSALRVLDDLSIGLYSASQLCLNSGAVPNNNNGLRFLGLGSGKTYIDGWSDGTSKAQNYPLVIGSRVNNTGSNATNSTTAENGTPVVFGSDAYDSSALVQMNTTTRGFLPPRMTNAQRSAISSPAVGLMVYCTDTIEGLYVYKSTGWTLVI
jgi:hypothetical protein